MKSKSRAKLPISIVLGFAFLVLGLLLLAASYLITSEILAFSGLGLTFWGALFLIITPSKYVEGNLLPITVLPSYSTIDRIIKQFNYKGKALHVPPFPEEVYLPEHLKGLKEMVAFIPKAEETNVTPAIEELVKRKFTVENPKGLLLTPPGLQLFTRLEEKTRRNFTKISLNDLCEMLPKSILDNYSLAKEMTMETQENDVLLKITGSIYQDLFTEARNLKSINLLGCPLISAVACAIATASGKPVVIQSIKFTPDNPIILAKYQLIQSE